MIHDRALLEIAADGRVGKEGQEVVRFAESIGDGEVAGAVIEFMMVFIVGRGPGESGEPVEEGNPVVRDVIEEGRLPHGHVVVIVGYYGHGNGEI